MLYPYFVTGADLGGGGCGSSGGKDLDAPPNPPPPPPPPLRDSTPVEPKGPPCTILRYPFLAD